MAAGRFLRRRYAGGGSIVRVDHASGGGGSSAATALLPRSLNQDPVAVRRNSETRDLTRRSGARYTPSHAVRTRAADGVPCFFFSFSDYSVGVEAASVNTCANNTVAQLSIQAEFLKPNTVA